MGRSLPKALLLLLLLFQLSNCQSTAHQKEMIGSSFTDLIRHISKQDVRISELESRGKQQELEMSGLKATVDEDKTEINFLKNRVVNLEASTENKVFDEQHHLRKRPFRLLPVDTPYKTSSTSNVEGRFYGPPTNCSELIKLGTTLNGYYMIRNNGDQGPIAIVYCRFYQEQFITEKQNLETFIGNIQLMNKKKTFIHFYVQRAENLNAPTYIRFKNEIFNIGKAFDMVHGIFSAPVSGLYYFQFHGLKDASKGTLKVFFSKNQRLVETTARTDASAMYIPVFLSTYLRLQPGDGIRVVVHGDGKLNEENVDYSNSYFTGHLVAEE